MNDPRFQGGLSADDAHIALFECDKQTVGAVIHVIKRLVECIRELRAEYPRPRLYQVALMMASLPSRRSRRS